MEIVQLIEKYEQGYDTLKENLDQVPEDAYDYQPTPESWSIRSIIAHIADSEINAYLRGRKIIAESGSEIITYDQDAWSKKLYYDQVDISEAMVLFRMVRKNMVFVLKKLPAEAWNNHIIHPETGRITLVDWIQLYIDHIENHVQQIHRNLYDYNKKT